MIRLAVSVEGATEEEFVERLLVDHLHPAIRSECPRFNQWLGWMESLDRAGS